MERLGSLGSWETSGDVLQRPPHRLQFLRRHSPQHGRSVSGRLWL
jgi:hypothetical protein